MKLLTIGIMSVVLLSACGNDKDSTTSSTYDSTAIKDHTMVDGTTDTMSNMNMSGTNMSIMGIMDKGMQDMKAMKSSGNPDNDFASMMKMHHMSAIEAAQVQLSQGTDASLKTMAQKMIDDQQKEIAEFNTFLSGHSAHGGGETFFKEAMGMMDKMNAPMDHSGSVDRQFVAMMIPHHQGAIDMSHAYIKSGAHEPKMKTMANDIITTQQKEIKELQTWMSKK